MYIYIYIYAHIYVYIYIYVYMSDYSGKELRIRRHRCVAVRKYRALKINWST